MNSKIRKEKTHHLIDIKKVLIVCPLTILLVVPKVKLYKAKLYGIYGAKVHYFFVAVSAVVFSVCLVKFKNGIFFSVLLCLFCGKTMIRSCFPGGHTSRLKYST